MSLGNEHPSVALSLEHLAETYQAEGFDSEAESLYKRALAIREKTPTPNRPATVELLGHYAAFLSKSGRTTEAEALTARARSLRDGSGGRRRRRRGSRWRRPRACRDDMIRRSGLAVKTLQRSPGPSSRGS